MGGDYEKGMYNQLMEVMARLDAMESSLRIEKREHKEDVVRLNKKIDSLTEENRLLKEDNARLRSKMNLLQIMKNRRSIRKYTGDKIPSDKLNQILQAGLLAPSSKNIRPVEFIVIEDNETLKNLAKSKQAGSGMLSDASCAVVVISNVKNADAWVEDCSLAMGYMLLMAESLEIATCWVQIRLRQTLSGESSGLYIKELLGIPDHYEVEAILSLGISGKTETPRSWNETEQDKIHLGKF